MRKKKFINNIFIVRIEHFIKYTFAQKKFICKNTLIVMLLLILVRNSCVNIMTYLKDLLEILTLIKKKKLHAHSEMDFCQEKNSHDFGKTLS